MRTLAIWVAASTICGCVAAVDSDQSSGDGDIDSIREALGGYIYIEQLAPAYNTLESEFIWEAHLPGVHNLTDCTFSWSAITPDGYGLRFLKQTTWVSGKTFSIPGDYMIRVDARCGGRSYGSAALAVHVAGVALGPNPYPPPPADSKIPKATSNGPSSFATSFFSTCFFWYAYDYDTHNYYRYRSSPCPGGGGRHGMDFNDKWEPYSPN